MNKKLESWIFVYLIISIPITLAQIREPTKEPIIKDDDSGRSFNESIDVGGGEINFEFIGPTSRRDIDIDKNLTISGEDTFTGDFVINVNRYEPVVLTTNLVEETNVPVYAFISGYPIALVEGVSIPKVSSMSLSVIGGDTKYIAGAPKWNPPTVFTGNDLGYIVTRIKRIPVEEEVPRRIDVKLRARIRYEGDVTAPVFGGKEVKRLRENRDLDIFRDGAFIDPQYEIFGGRAYVRVSRIEGNRATFSIYGADGVFINSVSASVGQETPAVNLFPETGFQEDTIRMRVDRIIKADVPIAEFEINGITFRHNKYDKYSVVDRTRASAGSEIDKYFLYADEGIGESDWVVEDIFIPFRDDKSSKFVVLQNINSLSRIILMENKEEENMREWYFNFYKIIEIEQGRKDMLIKTLRGSVNIKDAEISQGLKDQGIYSTRAVKFLINKLIVVDNSEEAENKINMLFEEFKSSFKNNSVFPILRRISQGQEGKAILRVGNSVDGYGKGDIIVNGVACVGTDKVEKFCSVSNLGSGYVTIRYYEGLDDNGNCRARTASLNLNAEFIDERRARIVGREAGQRDIPETTRRVSENDFLNSEFCGEVIELLDIESDNEVEVTILAGPNIGFSEAVFDLHIPIEKRLIKLAPEKIDDKINATKKLIADLDNMIEKLEKFVGVWAKVCLGVSAWFVLEAFFVGIPKYKQSQGEKRASYNANFDTGKKFYAEYDYGKTRGIGESVVAINDSVFYRIKDGKLIPATDEKGRYYNLDKAFYDDQGIAYEYDPIEKKLVPKKKLGSGELNTASARKLGDGRQEIAFGTDSRIATANLIRQFSNAQFAKDIEEDLRPYGENGFYVVFREGEFVKICQKKGQYVDGGERYGGDTTYDSCPYFAPKNGGTAEDRNLYGRMENEFRDIRRAQLQGKKNAFFGGKNFNINDLGSIPETNYKCEDILGKEKCKILFNACDPVVCPRSRCDLGGQYRVGSPSGIIGSGLVGSLVLCLPNIQENRGSVIVPICLSGILASLKGIRSHLEEYVACLEKQKIDGVSTGICDQMRSIFICSLIWREALTLLSAKGGLINFFAGGYGGGGGEYFESGIGGSLQQANEVTSFLVDDYADNVFSAYRGKGLPEIGAEVCKASIAQRIPFLDALVQEFGQPENPPQFTAYFEEAPYAPTFGKSQYKVYYHIYAGTPRRDIRLQYVIYLRSFGSSPRLVVNSGSLASDESADETIDLIGDRGYQEICVVLNGLEQCGFGKIVSTSFFLSTMDDYLASIDVSKSITSAEQCKAERVAPVSYTLTAGSIPYVSVTRVCSTSNPGVGRGEDRFWHKRGSCGIDERGVSLGDCWEFADTNRFSETERQALAQTCSGQVCETNQECMNGENPGKVTYLDSRGRICCEIGQCVTSDSGNLVGKYSRESTTLSSSDKNVIKQVNFNKDGNVGDEKGTLGIVELLRTKGEDAYWLAGLQYCNGERIGEGNLQYQLEVCKAIFLNNIKDDNKHFAKSRLVLALRLLEQKISLEAFNNELLKEIEGWLKDTQRVDETKNILDIGDREILKNKLEEIAKEWEKRAVKDDELRKQLEEEKSIGEQQKTIDLQNKEIEDEIGRLVPRIDKLINEYRAFKIGVELNNMKGYLTRGLASVPPYLILDSANKNLKFALERFEQDTEYITVIQNFNKIEEDYDAYLADTNLRDQLIQLVDNQIKDTEDWPGEQKQAITSVLNDFKIRYSNTRLESQNKLELQRAKTIALQVEEPVKSLTIEIDNYIETFKNKYYLIKNE